MKRAPIYGHGRQFCNIGVTHRAQICGVRVVFVTEIEFGVEETVVVIVVEVVVIVVDRRG